MESRPRAALQAKTYLCREPTIFFHAMPRLSAYPRQRSVRSLSDAWPRDSAAPFAGSGDTIRAVAERPRRWPCPS